MKSHLPPTLSAQYTRAHLPLGAAASCSHRGHGPQALTPNATSYQLAVPSTGVSSGD